MTEASDYLLKLAGLMDVSADALAKMASIEGIDGKAYDVIELSVAVRGIAERIRDTGIAVVRPSGRT